MADHSHRLATLTSVFLLASCASAPPPSSPEIEVPTQWTAAAAPPRIESEPANRWWQHFGDDRLDALVEEALERNYDLRAAAASVEAARAQARAAGAVLRPQVEAGWDAAAQQQVFVGLPIPGGPLKTDFEVLNLGVDVSWELDLWGRWRAGKNAAAVDAEAAREDYAAARLSLAARTVRAWFGLLEAQRQLELADETLESRRATTRRVTVRYRAGVGAALEVRLARSNEAQAESVVELRRRLLDASRRQLEILLGRYPSGELGSEAALPSVPPGVPAVLPADLVTRRPDLRAAERRLAAAGWRVAEARRALYPRLGFRAAAGSTADTIQDLVDTDFAVWNLAGSLLQPLFQGGRLRAAVEFAAASRERALAEYVEAALQAFGEVETALAAETLLESEGEALAASLAEAERAARLAESRYVAGVGDYLVVLESQRQAFVVESRFLAVSRQRLTHRVDLYLALGGEIGPVD